MRATIIVRQLEPKRIVKLVDVPSVDEWTVNSVVDSLKSQFAVGFQIDTSQVEMARNAALAA